MALTKLTDGVRGTITNAQISDLPTSKLTGTVADSQIVGMASSKLTGTLSDSQIAAMAASKLTGALPTIDGSNLTGVASDISNLQTNVALNFFLDAVDHARSIQNLQDGWTDQFEDQTGIDDTNSVNELYDASGDFYGPALIGASTGSASDHYTKTLTSNAATNDARTEREIIPVGSTDGNQIRVTLESQASAPSNFDNVSIGVRSGTTANCTATPVEILFSAGSGVDIQNGATAVSDWLDFTFDASLQHFIILDMSSGTSGIRYVASSAGNYYKSNANSYNTQNLSGATLQSVNTSWVTKVEVRSVSAGTTGNITLMAEPVVALAAPAKAHVTLYKQDVDAVTLNTDLLAWVSRSKQTVTSDFGTDEKLDATAHGLVNTDRVMLTSSGVTFTTPFVLMDGTNDHLSIADGTLGQANSKLATISMWINLHASGDSGMRFIWESASSRIYITRLPSGESNKIRILLRNSGGTDICDIQTTSTFTSSDGLFHLFIGIDMAAGKVQVFKNGTLETNIVTTAVANDTIDFIDTTTYLFASNSGTNDMYGDVGAFYFNNAQYIDGTVAANMARFAVGGKPVSLGANGSLGSGTQPLVFLNNTTATWQNNLGSGGNFTEVGAFTDGTDQTSVDAVPAGLNTETVYYVVNKTTNDFEVSLSSGGSAVNITDNGTGTHSVHAVTAVTLADEGTYSSYDIIAGAVDISAQPSDTDMVLFVQSKNTKDFKLHGQSLQWED